MGIWHMFNYRRIQVQSIEAILILNVVCFFFIKTVYSIELGALAILTILRWKSLNYWYFEDILDY